MKKGIINIDTIKIMIEVLEYEQHDTLYGVLDAISQLNFIFIDKVDKYISINKTVKEHKIFYKGKQIAGVSTGRYRAAYDLRDIFYVSVSLYGLTQYHESDLGSLECLLQVCRYLNNRQIIFRINEIDICYDIKCPFNNILTLLNRKVPNVSYFEPDEAQGDKNIIRIENVPKIQYKKVNSRAYTYNKTARNRWIKPDITRFELKLNSSFFKSNRKYMRAIKKSIDKYSILYFDSTKVRNTVLNKYKEQWYSNKLDVNELKIDKYKLTLDMDYVEEFITMLTTIDDVFTYDLVKPIRYRSN